MKITTNTFYCDNYNDIIIKNHKLVMEKFDIDINYHKITTRHGMFMDHICRNIDADVFVFFDPDCVPLTRSIYEDSLKYIIKYNTFLGAAQVSNHISPYVHVFAAPCFFMITKDCYESLGSPSFLETPRSDVAEEVSYVAETKNKKYKCIYPTRYESIPNGSVYRCSNYGDYGIGTLFGDKIYHLFESRFDKYTDLYTSRCNQILNDEFDKSTMISSTELSVNNV